MVGKFLGSLFGNGAASHSIAEQGTAAADEPADELNASKMLLDALRREIRSSGAQLPTVAYSQFCQIDDLLRALIVHMQERGASTEQRVLVAAIVGDYLPTSLRTYRILSPSSRHDDSPESVVLLTQLATLHSSAADLDSQVRSGVATELAIHGRFLQDKFDLTSLHLKGN